MKETGWCCGKLPSITRRRPLQSLYKTTASIVPFIPGQLTSGGALNSCPLLHSAIWPYQFWGWKTRRLCLSCQPASLARREIPVWCHFRFFPKNSWQGVSSLRTMVLVHREETFFWVFNFYWWTGGWRWKDELGRGEGYIIAERRSTQQKNEEILAKLYYPRVPFLFGPNIELTFNVTTFYQNNKEIQEIRVSAPFFWYIILGIKETNYNNKDGEGWNMAVRRVL